MRYFALVVITFQVLCAISRKPESYSVLQALVGLKEQLLEISQTNNDVHCSKCVQLAKQLLEVLERSNFKAPRSVTRDSKSLRYQPRRKPTNVILQLEGLESEVCG